MCLSRALTKVIGEDSSSQLISLTELNSKVVKLRSRTLSSTAWDSETIRAPQLDSKATTN